MDNVIAPLAPKPALIHPHESSQLRAGSKTKEQAPCIAAKYDTLLRLNVRPLYQNSRARFMIAPSFGHTEGPGIAVPGGIVQAYLVICLGGIHRVAQDPLGQQVHQGVCRARQH